MAWPIECSYKLSDYWLPQKRSARPDQATRTTALLQYPQHQYLYITSIKLPNYILKLLNPRILFLLQTAPWYSPISIPANTRSQADHQQRPPPSITLQITNWASRPPPIITSGKTSPHIHTTSRYQYHITRPNTYHFQMQTPNTKWHAPQLPFHHQETKQPATTPP